MAHILVVDDEAAARDVVAAILRGASHRVEVASNGAKAAEALKHTTFDLVITDIFMPEQDGIETIAALRRQAICPKILAISGGAMAKADYLRMAQALGAHACLAKPFTRVQLLQAWSN